MLFRSLDSLTAGKKDTTVFFRADKTVDYETMMKVMDTLHQAGYLKIGLPVKRPSKRSNLPLSTFLLRLALRQLFNRWRNNL